MFPRVLLLSTFVAFAITTVAHAQSDIFIQHLQVEVETSSQNNDTGSALRIAALLDAHMWRDEELPSTVKKTTQVFRSAKNSVFLAKRTSSSYVHPRQVRPLSKGTGTPAYVATTSDEAWTSVTDSVEINMLLDAAPATATATAISGPNLHGAATTQQQQPVNLETFYNAYETSFPRYDADMALDPLCSASSSFRCCALPSPPARSYRVYFLAFNATPILCTPLGAIKQAEIEVSTGFTTRVQVLTDSGTSNINTTLNTTILSKQSGELRFSYQQHHQQQQNQANISLLLDSASSTAVSRMRAIQQSVANAPSSSTAGTSTVNRRFCFSNREASLGGLYGFVAPEFIFGGSHNKLGYFPDAFASDKAAQCNSSSSSNSNNQAAANLTWIPPLISTTTATTSPAFAPDAFNQLSAVNATNALTPELLLAGCRLATVESGGPSSFQFSHFSLSCPPANLQLRLESRVQQSGLRRLFPINVISEAFSFATLVDSSSSSSSFLTFCVDVLNRGDVPTSQGSLLFSVSIAGVVQQATSFTPANRPGIPLNCVQRYCITVPAPSSVVSNNGNASDFCNTSTSNNMNGTAVVEVNDIFAGVKATVSVPWRAIVATAEDKIAADLRGEKVRFNAELVAALSRARKQTISVPLLAGLAVSWLSTVPALNTMQLQMVDAARNRMAMLFSSGGNCSQTQSPASPSPSNNDSGARVFPAVLIRRNSPTATTTVTTQQELNNGESAFLSAYRAQVEFEAVQASRAKVTIAFLVITIVVWIAVAVLLGVVWWRRRKSSEQEKKEKQDEEGEDEDEDFDKSAAASQQRRKKLSRDPFTVAVDISCSPSPVHNDGNYCSSSPCFEMQPPPRRHRSNSNSSLRSHGGCHRSQPMAAETSAAAEIERMAFSGTFNSAFAAATTHHHQEQQQQQTEPRSRNRCSSSRCSHSSKQSIAAVSAAAWSDLSPEVRKVIAPSERPSKMRAESVSSFASTTLLMVQQQQQQLQFEQQQLQQFGQMQLQQQSEPVSSRRHHRTSNSNSSNTNKKRSSSDSGSNSSHRRSRRHGGASSSFETFEEHNGEFAVG